MNWLQTTVGQVCLPTSQRDPTRNGLDTFRYIDISGIDREGKIIARADPVPCAEAPSRARKLVHSGDVLVSTVRPNLNAVAIVPDDLDGEIASTGFCVLRANPELAMPRYLFYRARHQEFVHFLVANATGASYPAVTDGVVRHAPLPLPPLPEQARIVDRLDEADRLRQLRREADAKATRILPASFLKIFGDPATNPMRWPMSTVGAVLTATDYGTSTRASDDGAGLPLIRMGNVGYDGRLLLGDLKYVELPEPEVAKFRLQAGDILFNRTNSKELVGKTGLWDVDMDAVLASYFIRMRVDREQVSPTFVWAFMNTAYMKRILCATARGAIGQANINTSELRAFPMYKPPLPTQQYFAERVRVVRSVLPTPRERSDLDDLFSLILQRAFSGRLTAKWREAHMKELVAQMEQQARLLNLPLPMELETLQ